MGYLRHRPGVETKERRTRAMKEDMMLKEIIADDLQRLTHASPSVCKAGAEILISMALKDVIFRDDALAPVRANLQFLLIAPSSSYKTPFVDTLEECYRRFFLGSMSYESRFTTEGLQKHLSQFKSKNPEQIYFVFIMRDEISNLVKEATGRGGNIYEFLSLLIDGNIPPYVTKERGREEYPPVVAFVIFLGTPEFLKIITDSFWMQGLAFRLLFIPVEKTPYQSIFYDNHDRDYYIEEIGRALAEIREIQNVSATEEFKKLYNQTMATIHDQQQNEWEDIESVPIEIQAMKKWPKIALKLSMVNCASRGGWTEMNGVKTLQLDAVDLEITMKELEEYKQAMVDAYDKFTSLQSSDKAQTKRIDGQRKSMIRKYQEAPIEERFCIRTRTITNELGEPIVEYFINDEAKPEDRKFVRRSYLMRRANIIARDMDMILQTLEDRDEIVIIEIKVLGKKPTVYVGFRNINFIQKQNS